MNPEQYLRSKDFKLRTAPGEWQTQCPFCGDKNKYGHLYVNREHGAYMCHRCGEKGSFYSLQVKLGDKPELADREVSDKWSVWADLVEICQDALLETDQALNYLRHDRGLAPETIGKYRLGWAPKDLIERLLEKWEISDIRSAGLMSENDYPLFWDRIIIPYYQRDHIVTIRGKQIGGNILQAKDTSIYLFGADQIRGHSEVFLCEGELDAMYLNQLGYPSAAVPGALSFQEHWSMYFEGSKRTFIVLDADETGRRGTAKTQALLGRRARPIELPVPHGVQSTDITEFFLRDGHTTDDFDRLVDSARGQRIYQFGDGLHERNELLKSEGLKLGFVDLDYSIHPGLLPGQVVTVLAKTGAGKTAFLTQVAHNLSAWQGFGHRSEDAGPGVPTLVLSLEQTKAEVANRLERIGRLYNPYASGDEMAQWHCNMRLCDENKIPPGDLPVLIEEFIDDVGTPPKLLIVDYLGYWSRSFKGTSKYEQVSEAIMELKRFAKEYEMAVIAPHQVSRSGKHGQRLEMDFARDSGVVEETSDFVFSLYRPNADHMEDSERDFVERAEVHLELLKSRHGNVGRRVVMLWAPFSLALVPRERHLEERVRMEWSLYDMQAMYEDVLQVHRSSHGSQLSVVS